MPIVGMPDGAQVHFPDDMPADQIRSLIATKFPQAAQTAANPDAIQQPGSGVGGITKDFLTNTGRFQGENWDAAKHEIQDTIHGTDWKPNPNYGAVHNALDWIGNTRLAHGIAGVSGAITSPLVSTVQGATETGAQQLVKSVDPTGTIPQDELADIHTKSGVFGGAAANMGMALAGASRGVSPETESIGTGLKTAEEIRNAKTPIDNSEVLADAAKGSKWDALTGNMPDKTRAGQAANMKISQAYEGASKASEDAYTNLKGINYRAKAPDFYQSANDLIDTLSKKIAPGTDEEYALNNFKEILDEAQDKYGTKAQPQVNSSILGPNGQPIVKSPAVPAQAATDLTLPEAIEIKTGLNSLLDSLSRKREFSTSGMKSIGNLKTSVQKFIDDAAKSSPQIREAIDTAEEAAFRKSQFKSPALRDLWNQEDYNAYRAATNNTKNVGAGGSPKPWLQESNSGVTSNADNFLYNLNHKDAGTVESLIKILPPEDAAQIIHDALARGIKDNPELVNAEWAARNVTANSHNPLAVGARMLNPFSKDTPLMDLAKRASKANAESKVPAGIADTAVGSEMNQQDVKQNDLTKEQKAIKLNGSNGQNSKITPNSVNPPSGKRGDATVLPESKKNIASVDTGHLVEHLGIQDDTQKALAKSNADTIVKVAQQEGADPVHMLKMAASESRLGANQGKDEKGLFQITDRSYKLLQDKYPEEMKGLDRSKPADNTKMAIMLGKLDAADFKRSTGKDPSPEEQRMLHVLGLGSTLAVSQNQDKKIAARTLSPSLQEAALHNRNLFVTKDNKNVSPALLRQNIVNDYNRWDKFIKPQDNTGEQDMND